MRQRPAGVPTSIPRSGWSAACGLSAATRRVGTQAAISETSTPITYAPASQRGDEVAAPRGALGSSRPARATRPRPAAMPTRTPAAAATAPSTSASIRTERSSCRPVAPMQRSRANSRVRWANRIEYVLAITSTETNSAIAANSSRISRWTSTPWLRATVRSVTKVSRSRTVPGVAAFRSASTVASGPVPS